jgi:uncharacterized protein involved in exopolysaccharide biosynthesis
MEVVENVSFLKWLYNHKVPLLVIQLIAIVLSIVFSSQYFMPKEYESEAIVYPSNMVDYSHESPSEQMIEFLNSVDIKNEVISKFNLRKHYDLNQEGKPDFYKLYHKFDHNVVIKPTEFGAVDITVSDISPDTAYQIVNCTLDILNDKIRRVQKEKSMEQVNVWKMELDMKKHKLDSMINLSKELSGKYGLLEYTGQSREVLRSYYQALNAGKGTKQFDELSQQIKNMQDYGIDLREVNWHIEDAVTDYSQIESKYEEAKKEANKEVTYFNLVSTPYISDSSTYPMRSLIVIGVCFAAFIFSVLFIKSAEKIKH